MTTTHYGDMEMIRRNSVEKGDESDEDGYTTSPSKSYGDGLHHDDNETERVPFILHQGAYSPTSSSFDKYPEGSNGQMMRERQLVKKLDYLIMPIAIILCS
ncbi:hypothetical protein FRB93_005347 [Tulasnella sp. JGI-2019a]|nr:hypothetical protein FRB93_005347 [Tulasnella sp. JGI-2019a]